MNQVDSFISDELDRSSFVPLYHQLYEALRQQIDGGQWKPGDQLPTEAELASTYNISQITIRKALNMLVDAGAIYRHRGKGTFVAQQAITSNLGQVVNIEEDMRQRGLSFRVELLETVTAPVSKGTALMLQTGIGEELACIKRLFIVENEPICLERSYFVHRLCPGILRQVSANTPLSTTLAEEYGLLAGKSEQTIRARPAGTEYARELQIAPEDPLLFVERVVYSNRNVPFMLARVFYRGDRYALRLGIS
jgi:GntR family transcriptional regulator